MKELKKIVKEILSLPFGWLILFLLIAWFIMFLTGWNFFGWFFRNLGKLVGFELNVPSDISTKSDLKAWVDQRATSNQPLSWGDRIYFYFNSLNPWRDGGLMDKLTGGNQ